MFLHIGNTGSLIIFPMDFDNLPQIYLGHIYYDIMTNW